MIKETNEGVESLEKEKFMQQVEEAFDTYKLKPENIFMFKLFQFEFDYDEEERTCTIKCPVSEIMLNPSGIVHGGVYAFISDTAMGHLNFRFKDAPYVTLEMKTSYFKAVSSGKLIATARYVREGHQVSFIESEVRNEEGEVLSRTTATFFRVKRKEK